MTNRYFRTPKETPHMPTQMEINELHARIAFYRHLETNSDRIADALEALASKALDDVADQPIVDAISDLAEKSVASWEDNTGPAYILVAAMPGDLVDSYQDTVDTLVSAGFSYDDDEKAFVHVNYAKGVS